MRAEFYLITAPCECRAQTSDGAGGLSMSRRCLQITQACETRKTERAADTEAINKEFN